MSKRLLISLAVVVIVGGGIYYTSSERKGAPYMSGLLTAPHKEFEENCATCHEPWGGVQEASCVKCHGRLGHIEDGTSKAAADFKRRPPRCTECHTDHMGRHFNIRIVDDAKCTGCHNIALHEPQATGDRGGSSEVTTEVTAVQSLLFPHDLHLEMPYYGTETCDRCHGRSEVQDNTVLNITFNRSCAMCHQPAVHSDESPEMETCKECHTREDYKVDMEAKSRSFALVESHLEHEGLKCMECHGNIWTLEAGTGAGPFEAKPCYDCHNEERVSNDCATCHSNHSYRDMAEDTSEIGGHGG